MSVRAHNHGLRTLDDQETKSTEGPGIQSRAPLEGFICRATRKQCWDDASPAQSRSRVERVGRIVRAIEERNRKTDIIDSHPRPLRRRIDGKDGASVLNGVNRRWGCLQAIPPLVAVAA
jgi:hypothetical protein